MQPYSFLSVKVCLGGYGLLGEERFPFASDPVVTLCAYCELALEWPSPGLKTAQNGGRDRRVQHILLNSSNIYSHYIVFARF